MLNIIRFFLIGIFFGIALTKGEVISWYRIQEMFRFNSFHMYGVIGTAVLLGILINQIIKRKNLKSFDGQPITYHHKERTLTRYLIGGIIFGMGWALAGACPGPIFMLIGAGQSGFLVVLLGALLGTFAYGILRKRLPH